MGGFTLIELVMTIVIIGIVSVMVGAFIQLPVQGYVDLGRRAALVDSAEGALRRMGRDIRLGIPNSVRITAVGAGFALEVLPTLDGGRYFTGTGTADRDLDFAAADSTFEINGVFQRIAPPLTTAAHRLVINNLGTTGNSDVYSAAGAQSVITPAGTSITYTLAAGVHRIALAPAYQFASTSPQKRVFVVNTTDAPITFLCDPGAGTLTRYAGYAISAAQPTSAAALGAATSVGRVADHVSTCGATTTTANIQERGLVTLDLGLADQGENVRLVHQVQLDNSR